MNRGNVNPTQHLPWWLRETTEKSPEHFRQNQDLNSELSEYECSVMNYDRRYVLRIKKLYHRPHFTVGGNWYESLQLQPLQRCYCANSGSLASAFVMRHHYSIACTQSLFAINCLLAVGRMGNLLCGCTSYYEQKYSFTGSTILNYNSVSWWFYVITITSHCARKQYQLKYLPNRDSNTMSEDEKQKP